MFILMSHSPSKCNGDYHYFRFDSAMSTHTHLPALHKQYHVSMLKHIDRARVRMFAAHEIEGQLSSYQYMVRVCKYLAFAMRIEPFEKFAELIRGCGALDIA